MQECGSLAWDLLKTAQYLVHLSGVVLVQLQKSCFLWHAIKELCPFLSAFYGYKFSLFFVYSENWLDYSSKYIFRYPFNAVLSLFTRGHQRSGFSLSTEMNWMMTFHSFFQDLAFGSVRVPSYSPIAQSVITMQCTVKTYFKYIRPQCLFW